MAKAFGGGADLVMCGGVFAGHDENPGEIIEENGNIYKFFYVIIVNPFFIKMKLNKTFFVKFIISPVF